MPVCDRCGEWFSSRLGLFECPVCGGSVRPAAADPALRDFARRTVESRHATGRSTMPRTCRQCGRLLQKRATHCPQCKGTGATGLLHDRRCSVCHGTGQRQTLYCPDHFFTWAAAPNPSLSLRPRTMNALGSSPWDPKCPTCFNTRTTKQYGQTVPCPRCRPDAYRAAINGGVFGPPPGWRR